jgi:hypothetical protein
MAKIMISLPKEFLKGVDRIGKGSAPVPQRADPRGVEGHARRQVEWAASWKLAPLKDLEQQWVGRWDSTDIIRYYRETRYGREARR